VQEGEDRYQEGDDQMEAWSDRVGENGNGQGRCVEGDEIPLRELYESLRRNTRYLSTCHLSCGT